MSMQDSMSKADKVISFIIWTIIFLVTAIGVGGGIAFLIMLFTGEL